MTPEELTEAMEADHRALNALVRGDPEPKLAMFSRAEDVTLANPLGPPVRGFDRIAAVTRRVVSQVRDGEPVDFERISQVVTAELAYIVEIERTRAKLGGSEEMVAFALRVTTVFRREDDGAWRICHRHADTVTTSRSIQSLTEQPRTGSAEDLGGTAGQEARHDSGGRHDRRMPPAGPDPED